MPQISLNWPGAVLILGVVFLVLFRTQIARFLDRTKSVGRDGLHAYDEQQRQAPVPEPDPMARFLEGYHSPIVLEMESELDRELAQRGLKEAKDVIKALKKSLAGAVLQIQFEGIERLIWESQLQALTFLNSRAPVPSAPSELLPLYEAAREKWPKFFEGRTQDQWLQYLVSEALIRTESAGFVLTVRGREYLKWRVEQGKQDLIFG